MHRVLVQEKKWIPEDRFLTALNICMMLPGPEATQLATYVGWMLRGRIGGLLAGGLFILPGFLSILALSWAYVAVTDRSAIDTLFLGLKAATLAIVVQAAITLSRRALRGREDWLLAGAAFLAIFFLRIPFPLIILTAALVGLVSGHLQARRSTHLVGSGTTPESQPLCAQQAALKRRQQLQGAVITALKGLTLWLLPIPVLWAVLGRDHLFTKIAIFFSEAAVVTFGGAYSVMSYVAQHAVEGERWLTPLQMLDGLGMAESTPGPMIQAVQFVAFLPATSGQNDLAAILLGTAASLLATWSTFAPCFLWIFLLGPLVSNAPKSPRLGRMLAAVTAAVVGVLTSLALWFALHVIFFDIAVDHVGPVQILRPTWSTVDGCALTVACFAGFLLWTKRLPTLLVLLLAVGLGAILRTAFGLA
jgi:chromate transporter